MQRSRLVTALAVLPVMFSACTTPSQETGSYMDAVRATIKDQRPFGEPVNRPGSEAASAAPMGGHAVNASMTTRASSMLLPRSAAPAPAIAGLEFLTGRWIATNPNSSVNEETWTPPRGNVLIGSFRQIDVDGGCSFVEVSQISLQGDEIVLRLRHLLGNLELAETQNEVKLFRLVSLDKDRVEFTGTGGAAMVRSLVYRRLSPTELEQAITFEPESQREAFVTRYTLDR